MTQPQARWEGVMGGVSIGGGGVRGMDRSEVGEARGGMLCTRWLATDCRSLT